MSETIEPGSERILYPSRFGMLIHDGGRARAIQLYEGVGTAGAFLVHARLGVEGVLDDSMRSVAAARIDPPDVPRGTRLRVRFPASGIRTVQTMTKDLLHGYLLELGQVIVVERVELVEVLRPGPAVDDSLVFG